MLKDGDALAGFGGLVRTRSFALLPLPLVNEQFVPLNQTCAQA